MLQFGEPKVSPAQYLSGGEALLVWRCLEKIRGGGERRGTATYWVKLDDMTAPMAEAVEFADVAPPAPPPPPLAEMADPPPPVELPPELSPLELPPLELPPEEPLDVCWLDC